MPDGNGSRVERLPVVVTGAGVSKILDIPVLSSGTADAQTEVIHQTVQEWDLVDNIAAMSFDTTSVNSGVKNGIIVQLPKIMNKPLLALACRKHVSELILKAIYEVNGGKAKSSQLDDFLEFKKKFKEIDQEDFQTYADLTVTNPKDMTWRNDVLNFCLSHLNEKQTRGDYEELLELTVIFLGGKPRKGIRFRKPGCLSRARWMARAIYSMKMFMLKGFHKYMADLSFLTHLENVTLFIAQFYVRFWFQTANAPAAPRLDLSLFKDISAFHDDKYINAARKTIKNHLWYLSQVNVALAFFDPGVDAEEKTEMVRALKHHSTRTKHSKMTSSYKASQINDNSTLKDFIGAETSCFFEILKLNRSFMDTTTPAEWSTNPEYQEAAERVKGLNVVNDVAERAVKLITDYHDKITTDSEQQQYLTQVIEWHRQRHPLKK